MDEKLLENEKTENENIEEVTEPEKMEAEAAPVDESIEVEWTAIKKVSTEHKDKPMDTVEPELQVIPEEEIEATNESLPEQPSAEELAERAEEERRAAIREAREAQKAAKREAKEAKKAAKRDANDAKRNERDHEDDGSIFSLKAIKSGFNLLYLIMLIVAIGIPVCLLLYTIFVFFL